MILRISDEGELRLLNLLINDTPVYVYLYTNDYTPDGTETVGTFTLPTYTGWTPISPTFDTPATSSGVAVVHGTANGFIPTDDTGLPQTIYGFFLSTASGTYCIGSARFDDPITFSDTSLGLDISFTINLGDTADICVGGEEDCGSGFSCDDGASFPMSAAITPLSVDISGIGGGTISVSRTGEHYYGAVSDPGCVGSDLNCCLSSNDDIVTMTFYNDAVVVLATYTLANGSWTSTASATNTMARTCFTGACSWPSTIGVVNTGS